MNAAKLPRKHETIPVSILSWIHLNSCTAVDRIGGATALLGSALNLKPVLKIG